MEVEVGEKEVGHISVPKPIEVSECDTESFEDLGPAVSLGVNIPEPQPQIVLPEINIPPQAVEEDVQAQVEQPQVTNITAVEITTPFPVVTGEMVQRKKPQEENR